MPKYVSAQIQAKRMAICRACPALKQRKVLDFLGFDSHPSCEVCGCFMDTIPGDVLKGKTWWANKKCPVNKWMKVKTN